MFRPLERLGKGLRSAPRDAMITDLTASAGRGRAFGFHRAMDTGGAIAGTSLGLLLIGGLGLATRTVLLVGAVLAFLPLPLLVLVREETRTPVRRSLTLQLSSLPAPARSLLVVGTTFALGKVSYMFYLLRASGQFPGRTATVAPLLLYLWFNLVYAAAAGPAGRWSDRRGRRPVLLAGLAAFALSCLGVAFTAGAGPLIFFFGAYGLAHGLLEGNFRAFLGDLSPAGSRGTALGLFHTLTGLAGLPGGLAAGLLWDRLGPPAAFVWGAALCVAAAVLLARSRMEEIPRLEVNQPAG